MVVVAAVSLHRQSGTVATSSGSLQQTDTPTAKERAAAPISEEKHQIAALKEMAPLPSAKRDSMDDAESKQPDRLKKQQSGVEATPIPGQKVDSASGALANERRSDLDKTTTAAQVAAQSAANSVAADQLVPGRAKDASNQPILGGGIGGEGIPASEASRPRSALLLPTVAPRWTVTSDGTLQRSLDFGRSWQIRWYARPLSPIQL